MSSLAAAVSLSPKPVTELAFCSLLRNSLSFAIVRNLLSGVKEVILTRLALSVMCDSLCNSTSAAGLSALRVSLVINKPP